MNKTSRIVFLSLMVLMAAATALSKGTDNRKVADNLLLYQRSNGGWSKNYDWKKNLSKDEKKELLDKKDQPGAGIDNGATHKEIRYLANAYLKLKDKRYKDAAMRGIQFLLEAQYDNGGWPQFYPFKEEI